MAVVIILAGLATVVVLYSHFHQREYKVGEEGITRLLAHVYDDHLNVEITTDKGTQWITHRGDFTVAWRPNTTPQAVDLKEPQ